MTDPRIAVIGAGPCGLAAAKALKDAGLAATVFERGGQVGGNWVYSPRESHSSVAETTHLISSKRLSQFRDFPMPDSYSDYPSHRQMLAYFEEYARRFDLLSAVRFHTGVARASKLPGDRWLVETEDGAKEEFDHLLVANGHHWNPRWPSYPGTFGGEYLHSHAFKRAEAFRDRRVLVIGGGNSACDIAVETSRVSAHTGISWRRGYYIVPKLMFGKPPDVLNEGMQWIPGPIRRWLLKVTWRVVTGGNRPYGLPEPDHGILGSHPVVNSELLYFVRHGRIQPYPDIARFEGSTVHFVDGRAVDFDVVIAATGFRISFPFFDPSIVDFGDGEVPLYLRVFHPANPTLYFVGLVQPAGAIWPLAEAQSRLIAQRILGRFDLPRDVDQAAGADARAIRSRYTRSPRHTIEVDFHEHLGELERALQAAGG